MQRSETGSDWSEEEETFLPTSHSQSRTKKHKKRRSCSPSEASGSDSEPPKTPLALSIHHNRQAQRASHHPTMAKPRRTKNSTKRAAQPAPNDTEKENEQLKIEILRLKKRQQLVQTGTSKAAGSGTAKAMEREVAKTSKTALWKVCKFIKNDTKLLKATKFVMEQMDLVELQGLQGADLVEAQESWKMAHSKSVRMAVNRQRNYVQQVSFGYQYVTMFANQDANTINQYPLLVFQELREYMEEEVFGNKLEKEFPNIEQMMNLVLRNKLDDTTPKEERKLYEQLFDNYWNILLPKCAGHSYWGPSKRHYLLISTGQLDGSDPEPTACVTASDEAFLAVLWENCYKKWWYKEQCKRNKEEIDEEHDEMKTPFTDAKGGQKKFGGWNLAGITRYDEICAQIEKNRMEQMDYIKAVEEVALKRIQKAENVDLEEKRRRKRSAQPKLRALRRTNRMTRTTILPGSFLF